MSSTNVDSTWIRSQIKSKDGTFSEDYDSMSRLACCLYQGTLCF